MTALLTEAPRTDLRADLYGWLMDHAADASNPDSHVFACLISARAAEPERSVEGLTGLSPAHLDALLARHFPRLSGPLAMVLLSRRGPLQADGLDDLLRDEAADLRALLMENDGTGAPEAAWLAAAVARACLYRDHLWQDLGLVSRRDLSGLLMRHFSPLAERNTGDMKWKKFFYKQLCDREGLNLCKAPSCGVCTDYAICFGPET